MSTFICSACRKCFAFKTASLGPTGFALNARKYRLCTSCQLEEANNRIYDLLLGDDEQAYKEARRYLEKHAPELYKLLP